MTKTEYYNFLSKTEVKYFLERMFMKKLVDIYSEDIIQYCFRGDLEKPEIDDITEEKYYIDFFIRTPDNEFVIETDGMVYHDERYVKEERYTRLAEKRNYIVRKWGNKSIIFVKEQLEDPELKVFSETIALHTVGDETLSRLRQGFRSDSNTIEPNPIQKEGLRILKSERKNNKKSALCVMPTGIGKTYFAAMDVREFAPRKCLFIAHRKEILENSMKSFKNILGGASDDYGFFKDDVKNQNCKYLFASIQSLTLDNLEKYFNKDQFDYIIVDETHHSAAPTWTRIHEFFDPDFLLGLTATPDRLDNQSIYPYYNVDKPTYEVTRKYCIQEGYLVPFCYIAKQDNVNYEGIHYAGRNYDANDLNNKLMVPKRDELILREYNNLKIQKLIDPHKPNEFYSEDYEKHSIGFCPSIEYADHLTKLFNDNGIKAVSIHSKMRTDRNQIIKDFNNKKYEIAFTRDLFNEGVDFPSVNTLLMLRPSESQTIMTQQLGRGIRLYGSKFITMVLDFIGHHNVKERFEGLGVGRDDFVDLPEKQKYYWDANGQTIVFDTSIIEEYDLRTAKEKPVKEDQVDIVWRNYRDFIGQRGEENLYAKLGNQNNDITLAMKTIDIIKKKPEISTTKIETNLKKFSEQTKAGTRTLFLAKVLGLLKGRIKNYEINPIFEDILKKTKGSFDSPKKYIDETTTQSEKYFYYHSLVFSKHNKWKKSTERADYTQMRIYPIFAIYQILIKLKQQGFKQAEISLDEYKYFCSHLMNNEQDITDAMDRIIEYRALKEVDQIRVIKLFKQTLKGSKDIDARITKILRLNKYIKIDNKKKKISIKNIKLITKKIEDFENLINSNKLILFDEDKPEIYESLLLSKKDLISYHS